MSAERLYDAAGHRWYRDLSTGLMAPGVTSVVGVIPKPQLDAWRTRHGDRADVIAAEAADFGTHVHDGAEALLRHQPWPAHLTAAESTVVEQIRRWTESRRLQEADAERFVTGWSTAGPYAGTADVVCTLDGERTVLDWKTGSGPHLAQHAQLSAYARAVDATRALLLFATADGVREVPVDLVRGWRVFSACHRLFVELYEAPCIIELAA